MYAIRSYYGYLEQGRVGLVREALVERARLVRNAPHVITSYSIHYTKLYERLTLTPGAPVDETIARLQAVPGIGPWTAHYIAMRALAWPDAFPDGDYGVRSALGMCSAAQARQQAEAWRPWRAYAVMHLWATLRITSYNVCYTKLLRRR